METHHGLGLDKNFCDRMKKFGTRRDEKIWDGTGRDEKFLEGTGRDEIFLEGTSLSEVKLSTSVEN